MASIYGIELSEDEEQLARDMQLEDFLEFEDDEDEE
jgi:hypothetical protein